MQPLRQLVYTSVSTAPDAGKQMGAILVSARRNNALDGITGLLYTDGYRFLQVIEGGASAIGALLDTLHADDRHRDLEVLSDRHIAERHFGSWDMADRRSEPFDALDERLDLLLADASLSVRGIFDTLVVAQRRAA